MVVVVCGGGGVVVVPRWCRGDTEAGCVVRRSAMELAVDDTRPAIPRRVSPADQSVHAMEKLCTTV